MSITAKTNAVCHDSGRLVSASAAPSELGTNRCDVYEQESPPIRLSIEHCSPVVPYHMCLILSTSKTAIAYVSHCLDW